MGDGHLNKCKVCIKKDVKIREEELREENQNGYKKKHLEYFLYCKNKYEN
jgi:hypothetical protein